MRAITAASSAPATARNTTAPVVSARGPRRPIWPCRPTPSLPTPKSRSAEARSLPDFTPCPAFSGSHHERTLRLPAEPPGLAMARTAIADSWPHAFLVRGLSDAAQPELLVDLRRHPLVHAGHPDPDRRDPSDALHAELRSRLQVGR